MLLFCSSRWQTHQMLKFCYCLTVSKPGWHRPPVLQHTTQSLRRQPTDLSVHDFTKATTEIVHCFLHHPEAEVAELVTP